MDALGEQPVPGGEQPPELAPLPENYIPVAMRPPLQTPYAVNDQGKPVPLKGVESIFLTATTVDIMKLQSLGKGVLLAEITKEQILHDIQFRGAISDFHPIKSKIIGADYDPLIISYNEDDIYGDGNNFEIAVLESAAQIWAGIDVEAFERERDLALERAHEAAEKSKPRSKRVFKSKPWITLGSEVDIEENSVQVRRDLIRVVVQRMRKEFNQSYKLQDKDAHELWNSSQMECRPFKDPNFELRKMEQDVGIQAVPPLCEVGVQAGGARPKVQSTQYVPQDLPPERKAELLCSPQLAGFLERVKDSCEMALIQNEVANIFEDDLSALSDEQDGGASGNRKESLISETQSFTHLTYSKNKVVSAIQWLPQHKGVVAVAVTENHSHAERVASAGRPGNAFILVWNFKDPIHPEFVMQSPYEVFCFQCDPTNPDIICGGCSNGQVVMWDMTHEHERIARVKTNAKDQQQQGVTAVGGGSQPGIAAGGDPSASAGAGDDTTIPVVKYKCLSDVQFSHHQVVTDLHWLPGIEITGKGRATKLSDGSKECNFFATIAVDGKIMFWDVRVEKLMKKGKKHDDWLDLVWKPTHSVHLVSLIGLDLGGTRFCLDNVRLDSGPMFVGSFDGELALSDCFRPEHDESPEFCKSCVQAHVGPIVSLERSPFFEDVILTVGDWSFQIWKQGHTAPLFQSGFGAEYYTVGCWSPTRPGVIYLANTSGGVEVWDMLDRSHEPSIKATLAATPIVSLRFNAAALTGPHAQQAASQLLAVGDSAGVLRIVELPRNLRRPVPNERRLMSAFLGREEKRLLDVQGRAGRRNEATKAAEERKKELEAATASEALAREMAAREAAASGQLPPGHR